MAAELLRGWTVVKKSRELSEYMKHFIIIEDLFAQQNFDVKINKDDRSN